MAGMYRARLCSPDAATTNCAAGRAAAGEQLPALPGVGSQLGCVRTPYDLQGTGPFHSSVLGLGLPSFNAGQYSPCHRFRVQSVVFSTIRKFCWFGRSTLDDLDTQSAQVAGQPRTIGAGALQSEAVRHFQTRPLLQQILVARGGGRHAQRAQ